MIIDTLLKALDSAYDSRRHRDSLEGIWRSDRWFDTMRQYQTACYIVDRLKGFGITDAKLLPYPCDGRTRFQDWTTRMAWDCSGARLSFADDGVVLADREQCPTAAVQWAGALASRAEPHVAEVLDIERLESLRPGDIEGKFILGSMPPQTLRMMLQGCNPAAIISDHLGRGRGYNEQTTKWWNVWTDRPSGWHAVADDRAVTGFALSQAKGAELRRRLANGASSVKLAGFCDARIYAGECNNITAVLPGRDPTREIWLYGHAYEPGAHDNASGVAAMMEALTMLKTLVERGQLKQPRYSIRMIATEECLGMLALGTLNPEMLRRPLAGMNIDGVGDPGIPEDPFSLHFGPLSQPSFAWPVAALIGRRLSKLAKGRWHLGNKLFVPTADDMIADPLAGVPSMWFGKGKMSLGYHSDADTPDVCCPVSMRHSALLTAAWAYTLATLDAENAAPLLAPAVTWTQDFLIGAAVGDARRLRKWAAGRVFRDLARWGVNETTYSAAASQFCAPSAPPLDGLSESGSRPTRKLWGTYTFDTLPQVRREGLSNWSSGLASGLYWCDGQRTLPDLVRLAEAETGQLAGDDIERGIEAGIEAKIICN